MEIFVLLNCDCNNCLCKKFYAINVVTQALYMHICFEHIGQSFEKEHV